MHHQDNLTPQTILHRTILHWTIWHQPIWHRTILVESRSWRDHNLKFGPNCDLEVDNLENNKKIGEARRIWKIWENFENLRKFEQIWKIWGAANEKFGINCASAEAQFGTGRGIIFQIIQILNSDPASSYFPLNTPTCNLVRTYHHSPRSKNVNFPKLAQNNVWFYI